MERRRAITTAGAATLTLLAGAGAIAMGSGIVNSGPSDDVGNIPISTPTEPLVAGSVDPSAGTIAPAPPVAASTAPPVTTSSASTIADGRSEDDEGYDDDERDDDERDGAARDDDERAHEDDEEREYEGANDDD